MRRGLSGRRHWVRTTVVEAEDALGPPSRAGVRLRLDDRYRLGSRLGGGGMAVVYRAIDERLGREVAVKLLDPARYGNDDALARFEREAQAAASIQHPNVVAVHDFGRDGDVLFIVMECLPGRTMADEIAAGPLEVSRVTALLDDVLAGLAAAHDKQVLHRDIKPGNVLITVDGRAKLADFGIAAASQHDLTETGVVIGTAAYLAPERVRGGRATVRSDLYAVGIVAYEALSGRRPFDESSPLALAYAITAGDAPPLRELRPDAPGALCDVIARSMSVDPAARFASARDFRSALEGASAVRTGAASTPTRPQVEVAATVSAATERMRAAPAAPRSEPTPPAGRRPRRRLAALGLAFAIVAAALIVAFVATRASSPARDAPPTVTSGPGASLPPALESAFDRLDDAVRP